MVSFLGGLLFLDYTTSRLMFYDPAAGGVHAIGATAALTGGAATAIMAASSLAAVLLQNSCTTGTFFPDTSGLQTSPYVQTSLMDFDNTLTKTFRGIKVDYVPATDGDGGTIDVAYQVDNVDGSYTSLANSVTSGTEYNLAGVTGRAISAKVTLNKGTSTKGPILKRLYVRAAPQLQQYRSRQYIFHCYGPYGSASGVRLRDGTYHPKSGFQMAQDLVTIATQTKPFTVVDKFGTIAQAVVDLNAADGFDMFEERSELDSDPKNPGTFAVRFTVREVMGVASPHPRRICWRRSRTPPTRQQAKD